MRLQKTTAALAAIVAVALGFLVWGFVLSADLQPYPRPASDEAPLIGALWQCSMLGFLAVGTLIAGKRPRNPMGWLLLSFPLVFWTSWALDTAMRLSGAEGRALPAHVVQLGWLDTALGPPATLAVALFLVLAFPDGELTRLGRRILRVSLPVIGAVVLLRALTPMPLDDAGLANPNAIAALAPAVDMIDGLTQMVVYAFPFAAWDLVRRYRRSEGAQRQQFRWVVRSFLAAPVAFATSQLGEILLSGGAAQWTDLLGIWLASFGIAAGMGVSVLRYRLYDIDRVVSRTVSYVVVTAILVSIYAGGVLTLGGLARTVADGTNDLVVALSTLLVAAAFQPVRRRVQTTVDRRFNRARYDAMHMTGSFAQRLRDEVDLGELRGDLAGTVRTSLAPRSVSIWLPEETTA